MATVSRVSPTATSTDVEMMGGNMTFFTVDYVNTNASTGPEGAQAHMQLGQEREAMFGELVALTNTYCVSGIIGAPVICSM